MYCSNCGTALIWGGDNDAEELGLEFEGIVSNFTCPSCDSFTNFYIPTKEGEQERCTITIWELTESL